MVWLGLALGMPDAGGDDWHWHRLGGPGLPQRYSGHSLIWTGRELILWGGRESERIYRPVNTGSRYDFQTRTWMPTSQEVIVWDGIAGRSGRYRPLTDTWTAFTTNQAPVQGGAAVWTDHGLMVFERASTSGLSLYHSPSVAPFLIEPPRPRSAILGTRLEW